MHVSNKEYQKCASDWSSCLCFVKLPIYCASYQGPPLPTVRLSQTLFFGYLAGYSTWMELARHAWWFSKLRPRSMWNSYYKILVGLGKKKKKKRVQNDISCLIDPKILNKNSRKLEKVWYHYLTVKWVLEIYDNSGTDTSTLDHNI